MFIGIIVPILLSYRRGVFRLFLYICTYPDVMMCALRGYECRSTMVAGVPMGSMIKVFWWIICLCRFIIGYEPMIPWAWWDCVWLVYSFQYWIANMVCSWVYATMLVIQFDSIRLRMLGLLLLDGLISLCMHFRYVYGTSR